MDLQTLLLANLLLLALEAGALWAFTRAYPEAPGLYGFWRCTLALIAGATLISLSGPAGARTHHLMLAVGEGLILLGWVFLNQGIADYWTRPFQRLGWHIAGIVVLSLVYYHLTGVAGSLPWRVALAGTAAAFELGLGAWLFAREGARPAALVMTGFALSAIASGPAILFARNREQQHFFEALNDYAFLLFNVLLAMALIWMIIADLRVRLDQLARTDDLTGLMNRRALDSEGARRMGGAAAIVVDLDHFKQLNDQHGHGAGDDALRQVAELLRASLGDGDLAARLGGEEFLVLVAGANLPKGVERAERLRQGVAAMRLKFDHRELGITASFGVAVAQGPAESWAALLQRADTALYAAKQAGRNCVCVAPTGDAAQVRAQVAPA